MKSFNSKITTFFTQIFVLITLILFHANSALKYNNPNNNVDKFLNCLPLHTNASIPINKAIYTPKNASFPSILQAYIRNLRFNVSTTPKPLAIIAALDKSHVKATVICAKANGLEIRVRSGGHDYEGLSYVSPNPFVILDFFNLRSIDIDPVSQTGWVESGATLGELYYNIANKSNTLAFPAGVCFTVGVGGHFSGGGYGTLLRKFGLTVDHIVDAEIVDPFGRILNRETMGEDLFWAIRGGGASSFCVVLRWKIKLVRVPDTVTTFLVQKKLNENASDIFYQWQHVAPNIDPNLFVRVQAQVVNKVLSLSFIALYLGKARDLVNLMDNEFPLLGLKQQDCVEQRWVESHLLFNNLPLNTPLDIFLSRIPYMHLTYDKHKSDYVEKAIPKAGLDKLWEKMIEFENVTMQFNPYGGKMGEVSENATPFPHRKGRLFKIQYLAYWADPSLEVLHGNMKAIREVYGFMTQFVSNNPREAFLNYRDIDIGTNVNNSTGFAFDFFKGNLKRLLMVKARVDPTNFFRNEQSIPVLPSYTNRV
ncbi:berberine bridge enzyme-like 8 [Silene latifolia]|uniref:berberine bridge enzyme-like 8 n=1 Tax=Silene latifolia TaxID=37657 RepID=UPI003D78863C